MTGLALKAAAAAGLLGLFGAAGGLWVAYGPLIALDGMMAFCF